MDQFENVVVGNLEGINRPSKKRLINKNIKYKQIQEDVHEVVNFINKYQELGWEFVCVFGEHRISFDKSFIYILFKKEI